MTGRAARRESRWWADGRRALRCVALISTLLGATGCDQAFNPLEQNLYNFSLFGFLDVTADTQWIRVTPPRTSINTHPDPIHVLATLENLRTGETITLNDSLFRYQGAAGSITGTTSYAHNFWTASSMDFGTPYRLVVRGADGSTATVAITTPSEITSIGVGQHRNRTSLLVAPLTVLRIRGAEYLAMVSDSAGKALRVSWRREGEDLLVTIIGESHAAAANRLLRATIVAAGSDYWPFPLDASLEAVTLPLVSNVEVGAGFVAGISRTHLSFDTHCTRDPPPIGELYCEQIYGARSATLEGAITNCDGDGVSGAEVQLRELNGDGRILTVRSSGRDGLYRLDALNPDILHGMRVSHIGLVERTDSLIFASGQVARLDLTLYPLDKPC